MKKMTGVFWGAFDPPTEAHRAIIQAFSDLSICNDLLIVVNNHSYKTYTHPLEQRLELLKRGLPEQKTTFLWQDDANPMNYQALEKIAAAPLCAIAGWDAYKNWVSHSTKQERALYKAIAVVPRGGDEPELFDSHAFIMPIDPSYRDTSSTKQRTRILF